MAKDNKLVRMLLLLLFIGSVMAAAYFGFKWYGSQPPPLAGLLAAEKGYGVTIDLTRYEEAELAETLRLLRERDLTWLRQPIPWAEIEPEPGRFRWQQLDRILAAVSRENEAAKEQPPLKLIVVLHTTPAWARPPESSPTTPPTELRDFGRFVRAFAARYGPLIDYYQLWHEPNLSANWGDRFVDPAGYADLLREASLNIRAADPRAYILAAALAPTLEEGPLNLNEWQYLEGLYRARADRWFDIVAAEPYGFASEPADPARPDELNFRRPELLRQVMLRHEDAETPIWATAFGWNALPDDWTGRASPWKTDIPAVQAQRTVQAITQARRDWPWLGPMLAIQWEATGLAPDDPAQGFALLENPSTLRALQVVAINNTIATPGQYSADHPTGRYSPGWRFAATNADIPRHEPRALMISFEGTRFDLTVHRGPYKGYLWVTVDKQPEPENVIPAEENTGLANGLPHNSRGQSYISLYDPLYESETLTLARHLTPGYHEVVIEADGGWGQWAIGGWTVSLETDTRPYQIGLAIAVILAALSGWPLLRYLIVAPRQILEPTWRAGEGLTALYNRLGERNHIILTFALALVFYVTPGEVSLALLPLLALAVLIRPDLGLLLVAFTLSFHQAAKQLPFRAISPVELALFLSLAGFIFRGLLWLGRAGYADEERLSFRRGGLSATDWAALLLAGLGLLATLLADNFGVAMREWRVVIFESVLFYFLVRLGADFGPRLTDSAPRRWVWRLVDAFVAGAVLQAGLALYLYYFTDYSITAEGVHRALGIAYGSPNNLALFLDRAWPILAAVALLSAPTTAGGRLRRGLYGVGLVLTGFALYLTFSKGGLLVGLPISVVAMTLLYVARHGGRSWRRALLIAGGGLLLLALALIPFSRTERFRSTFVFRPGSTAFFRLKLWQASFSMLRDYWPLGAGPDNFLYKYRTRYILPEAWQEPNLSHPHNFILDFGVRLGIGGIILILWLQWRFWRQSWRLYRRRAEPLILGLMGSMVAFLGHGLVDNSFFLVDLAFAFFLAVGLVERLSEEALSDEG